MKNKYNIKIKLPENVKIILDILKNKGYNSYIVGGSIRNSLLNIPVKDWDITTNALPEEIIDIFTSLGYKIVPTGLKHGTITIVIGTENFEVTTFRKDGNYSNNRCPDSVEFINDLKEDLSRRDFTINAMAYNSQEGLIDYFNSIEDIKKKIIRCVGNPDTRFNEDGLRLMRCIRFAAQLSFNIDYNTILAIKRNANLIANISKERIHDELNKILVSDSPEYVAHMYSYKILNYILPEYANCFKCSQNNPYHIYNVGEHIKVSMMNVESNLPLRLTMLFHDIGKPYRKFANPYEGGDHFYGHAEKSAEIAKDIMKRLKYDNTTIEKVCLLIKYHDTRINSDKTIKKLLNKLGKENMYDFLKVREADIKAQNLDYYQERHEKILRIKNRVDEIIAKEECFSLKDLAINGKDLIDIGFKQGKEIGEILNWLLGKIIEDPQLNNKEELIRLVKEKVWPIQE